MGTREDVRLEVVRQLISAGVPHKEVKESAISLSEWILGNDCPPPPFGTAKKE